MRKRATDEAQPRVWMEALERRVMMDAPTVTVQTAATVHLDPHFGDHGYAMAPLPFASGGPVVLESVVAAPGGKIYAAAQVWPPGDTNWDTNAVARFNADGTPDDTFGQGGVILIQVGDFASEVGILLVQPDGKLVAVMHTLFSAGTDAIENLMVLRFNVDGTPDLSFGTDGRFLLPEPATPAPFGFRNDGLPWFDYLAPSGWLQHDGKIMAMYQDTAGFGVVRLNPNGTPDDSLAPEGQRFFAEASLVDANDPWLHRYGEYYGTLEAVNPATGGGGVVYISVDFYGRRVSDSELLEVRFDADWNVIDRRTVVQASPSGGGIGLAWTADNQLLVMFDDQMMRLGVDGRRNESFGVKPFASARYWSSAAVQNDGKIVVISDYRPGDSMPIGGIQRLNADGTPDNTFAGGEMAFGFPPGVDFWTRPLVLADNSIILGGTFDGPWFARTDFLELVKVLPDGGTPDTFDLKAHGTAPLEYDTVTTASDTKANTTTDSTAGFGSLADHAGDVLTVDDIGLFAVTPGASVFNPSGKRDVFDDGTGAL